MVSRAPRPLGVTPGCGATRFARPIVLALLMLLVLVIQKKPQGLFALKGRVLD